MTPDHPGGLTREHVTWAYRLLLDRDPESEEVIESTLAGARTTAELRHQLMTSTEFRERDPDIAQTNDRTVVIKEIAPGVRLFIDLSDQVIGLNILRGRYEEDEIRFVRRMLKPGDSAIEVGGHIGFFTMQMAAAVGPDGRVYAFEPLEAHAELLERSISENGFGGRIRFQRAAAGAAPGTATLSFPVETLSSGDADLVRGGSTPPARSPTKEVPVVALDAIELRRPVRFIKMDAEGAEPQVLRGASRILTEDKPVILSELQPTELERASGITADQFLAQIAAFGYHAHRIEGGEIGTRIGRAPAEPVRSVVLVPAA
jgi:FkbM family methyltransferase